MQPSKPGNHPYGSFQARTQGLTKKLKQMEIEGTASNDMESIQIAPRDYQKLEFWRNSKFFQILTKLTNSTPINAFDSKSPHLPFFAGPEGRK